MTGREIFGVVCVVASVTLLYLLTSGSDRKKRVRELAAAATDFWFKGIDLTPIFGERAAKIKHEACLTLESLVAKELNNIFSSRGEGRFEIRGQQASILLDLIQRLDPLSSTSLNTTIFSDQTMLITYNEIIVYDQKNDFKPREKIFVYDAGDETP